MSCNQRLCPGVGGRRCGAFMFPIQGGPHLHENCVDAQARANRIRVNGNTYLMGIIQLGRWATLTLPCKLF